MDNRVIVFPLVPKTGGTSLDSGLKDFFHPHFLRLKMHTETDQLRNALPERRSQLLCLTGHFTVTHAQEELIPLIGRAPAFVCVVRDPVRRVQSIYSYLRSSSKRQEDRSARLLAQFDDDINLVVSRSLKNEKMSGRNSQCRFLCGTTDPKAAVAFLDATYLTAVTTPAINALLQVMATALDRKAPSFHMKNSNSSRFALDPDLERQLREANAADQYLYDWVCDNQERLFRRGSDGLANAVARRVQASRASPPGQLYEM
jgi:hypothetical protein